MPATSNLFISYAGGDDESFVNRLYGDLNTSGWRV